MKKIIIMLIIAASGLINFSCNNNNDPQDQSAFKGYIYYSNGGSIYRIKLDSQYDEELMSNAAQPDLLDNGKILAVESYPTERIIITDLTGANRQSVIESESYTGPKYKYMFDKPRISYDQQYVVYEGDNVYNPVTYVINTSDGSLVATIGDYDQRMPIISPSWAPDGSIIAQGWTSMNNGIYKISSDFTSMERIDPNLTNVYSPSVSPDGSTIAFIRDEKLWTMEFDGSNPVQFNIDLSKQRMPTWSPDSKYIAFTSYGGIYIVDRNGKQVTEIKHAYAGEENQLSWRY